MTTKYTIRKAGPGDKLNIQEFLIKHFFGQSPLHEAFQLYNHPPPDKFVMFAEDNRDFALQVFDSEENLIGVALVEQHSPSWRDPHESLQSKNYVGVLEFTRKQADPEQFEETTELYILSVSPEGRNQGIGRKLVEECVKVAREYGFKTMYIDCVSDFSARIVKSLGWREHYRMSYAEYGELSGTGVVVNTPPPHNYLLYYVTDL